MREETKARVLTFGFSPEAEVTASELKNIRDAENRNFGINFKLVHNGSAVPVLLSDVLSETTVTAALAAAAVAIIYGFNLVEVSQAFKNFKSPAGRLNTIDGIKGTLIIDDTYNSSPQSSFAALEAAESVVLKRGARKFAVFGDMLELGSYTEEGHRETGRAAARRGIDVLATVGERARDIGRGALEAGISKEKIFNFSDIREAGLFLQDRIREGDLILVKGSQGMRMEKIVKEIMAEPLRAEELLVRQGKEWQNRI
jgi:UDP-N-acetylmuramoyl-tripeptide--D-alanyl-D-alanine ligase